MGRKYKISENWFKPKCLCLKQKEKGGKIYNLFNLFDWNSQTHSFLSFLSNQFPIDPIPSHCLVYYLFVENEIILSVNNLIISFKKPSF